jgi:hypothetical protein
MRVELRDLLSLRNIKLHNQERWAEHVAGMRDNRNSCDEPTWKILA